MNWAPSNIGPLLVPLLALGGGFNKLLVFIGVPPFAIDRHSQELLPLRSARYFVVGP